MGTSPFVEAIDEESGDYSWRRLGEKKNKLQRILLWLTIVESVEIEKEEVRHRTADAVS